MARPAHEQRLYELIRARSFATGDFTLASGKKSTLYVNMKPTMMTAEGSHLCARAFYERLAAENIEYVGGLEMGAVPIAAATAAYSFTQGKPIAAFFVRKKQKEYGAKQLVEGLAPGESIAGKRVAIAEDVTTTGGSALQAIAAARESGAIVDLLISILDREEGAADLLRENGVRLTSVFSASDFTAK
jgi:orotate phosphoribosyltransferase